MVNGSLIVISAPSGAGKSSLVKALIESTANVQVAVSHTTRPPRPGEQDGVHYHFVAKERFQQMVREGAFIEHAQVFDNFYGTAKSSLEDPLQQGIDLILEIDWQGAQQIRTLYPDCISLFIAPPGLEELRKRLRARGQDNEEVIERRMRDAQAEMAHVHEFDYLVINEDFNEALTEIRSLLTTLRLRRQRQVQRHADLMNRLLSS
ncbi:MAG: guanylate kinase [Gammaproteobacteria bacterium SHHR-1]|uniref:guanylate kinase n=1 Tax=Magnetovirga frankeli TaxID=947516 RepID=UPI00328B09B8